MKSFVIGAVLAVALLGLAACGDTDDTTTQGVPPTEEEQLQPQEPAMTPTTPQEPAPAPAN